MGYIIALAGKGGTGKTTIAALAVRIIKEKRRGSVLAVDADPNSNLLENLGLESKETIGQILDEIAAHPEKIPGGMRKDRFIEYRVQAAITEGDGFDGLTMGRPEGAGCYCYVNNILRDTISKLIKDYDYIVIDNEAGLEHLSRKTTRIVNTLLVISDATTMGLKAAKRIMELVKELDIKTDRRFLIINYYNKKELEKEKIEDLKANFLGFIPWDNQIEKISLNGSSLMDLKEDAISINALREMEERIWR